jgi:DNA-directed RNA polymerase, mitochondrial
MVTRTGKCVEWTVPATGLKVRQEYYKMNSVRVKTVLMGQVYKPRISTPTTEPLPHKQANSMSPNYVHSLDAAALMMTVRNAKQHGVESFAMVHDSYGAPAGDCAVLSRAARQAFVSLYTQRDVLGQLRDELLPQVAEEDIPALLDTMPEAGQLDVSGVLASDFFFA